MTKIGVDFDFNKLNRPATMEEYKASPCASHDKNSEMEEQVHRLQEINKNILKSQAVKAGLISKLDTETIKFDEVGRTRFQQGFRFIYKKFDASQH